MLDDLDLLLVKELEVDARQGAHALAKKLGAKRTTVNNRLKKLIDSQIVTIGVNTNRASLGYALLFMIGINVRSGKSQIVTNQLVSVTAIKAIVATTGRYNIIAWAVFRSQSEFKHFVSDELGSIPDLIGMEANLLFERVKNTWRYFTPQTDITSPIKNEATGDNLSELSLSMIRELELAPRQNMTELAEKVGSNRWIVAREFRKLLDNGTIAFFSIVDPFALGRNIRLVILVKVNPSAISVVANELAHHQTIMNLSLATGDFQIVVSAIFKDFAEVSDFLSSTLDRIPEIVRYETIPIMKWIKYNTKMLS